MTWRFRHLRAGLLAFALVMLTTFGVEMQERARFKVSLRASVSQQLEEIHSTLESELNANFLLTRGLIAYVRLNPAISTAEFETLAQDLFQYRSSIRNIALAPDNVIRFVYPLEGNEAALGLDYRTNHEQWSTVREAMETHRTVMAGPVSLVQGGVAFIGRTPIYISEQVLQQGEDPYWGIASIVIDRDRLFELSGLDFEHGALRLALRGADGLGPSGALIAGEGPVFEEAPAVMDVSLPDGYWQLAAVPRAGWNAASPFLWPIRLGGLSLALLIGLVMVLWQKRQYDARRRLVRALKDAESAHRALAENEAFLDAIVEHIPDTLFVKDARELRYIRFNRAAEQLLGRARGEILGRSDHDIFPDHLAAGFVATDREVLERGEQREIEEERVQTRHQGVRTMHTKKIPLMDSAGNPQYLLGISQDITERKRAEQEKAELESQLRQALKMESLGTLAGGIAHDFNNILAAILGYSELALLDAPEGSAQREKLAEVIRAGERAKQLVKHILNFSRKGESERIPVQFDLVVEEALKLLRASIPTTVRFEQNIDRNAGQVMANPTQLHQIVMNLCTNAAQAMAAAGGVMTVSLREVELEGSDLASEPGLAPGSYVHLQVRDTGPGIAPAIVDKVFDPYFTTKDVGKGSGMGLAVVMGIVRGHDGMVAVHSNPGEGAVFDVYLPTIHGERQQDGIDRPASIPGGNERILVVDDERAVAAVLRLRLQIQGYQVTALTSSLEALDAVKRHPQDFDLVVTDQTMPDLTGDQLALRLWGIRPGLPVIICTGYSANFSAENAAELGVAAYVEKPVDPAELVITVREVLDSAGGRARSSFKP